MQKYLLPAIRYANRAMPNAATMRTFMIKRRTLAISMALSFLILTTMGLVTVRGLTSLRAQDVVMNEKHAEGKSMTTISTNATNEEPLVSDQVLSSSSDMKTNVIVNNQVVDVPANGSVSKTVTNDNGTTHIDVSSNTTSTGNSYSSSVSSTQLNVSASTFSTDTNFHSP